MNEQGTNENQGGGRGYCRCAVRDCSSRTGMGIIFRLFPSSKKPELASEWRAALPKNINISRNTAICELHFNANQFERVRADGRKKLKENAIPSLFDNVPELERRRPLRDVTCSATENRPPVSKPDRTLLRDHLYARPVSKIYPTHAVQSKSAVQEGFIQVLKVVFTHEEVMPTEPTNTLLDDDEHSKHAEIPSDYSGMTLNPETGFFEEPSNRVLEVETKASYLIGGDEVCATVNSCHFILDEGSGHFIPKLNLSPESSFCEELDDNEQPSPPISPSKMTREELLQLVSHQNSELAALKKIHSQNEQKILDLSNGHMATCEFRSKYIAACKAKERIQNAYKRGLHSPWLSEARLQKLLVRLGRKSNRGMKWETEDIRDGLILKMKCGTSGYSAFVEMFKVLPSVRCLGEAVQFIKFDAGILEDVFNLMEDLVKRMSLMKRFCTLVLDEIAIEEGLRYDNSLKKWVGHCTLSSHSGKASKALVFILAGITVRWKLAVAVHFTRQKSDTLKEMKKNENQTGEAYAIILKDIINKSHGIGLNVKAIVSDMGADNLAFWKVFGVKGTRQETEVKTSIPNPADPDSEVFIMPDSTHLFKSIKSMLENNKFATLPKDVIEEEKLPSPYVDYGHIQDLYQFEKDNELKVAFRLRPENINCKKHFKKMKVGSAKAVICHRTGVGLKQLAEEKSNPSYITTAWFIMLLNTFFTLVTCRSKGLAVSNYNKNVYGKAISLIKKVDYVFTHMKVGKDGHWKPAQRGVRVLCSSVLSLITYFIDGSVLRFLMLGRFTSDCIENLFSCICLCQSIPHAVALLQCLKVITLAQFSEAVRGSSYEYDECASLGTTDFLEEARKRAKERTIAQFEEGLEELMNNAMKQLEEQDYNIIQKWEEMVIYDMAGSVICAIKSSNVIVCENCVSSTLWTSDVPHEASCITSLKEFTDLRSDSGKKQSLVYVSDVVFRAVLTAEISFRMYREKTINFQKTDVKEYFVSNLMYVWDKSGVLQCHDLGRKILSFYIDARLKEYGKRIREEVKEVLASQPVDRSSKSIAMHQAADNIESHYKLKRANQNPSGSVNIVEATPKKCKTN